MKLLTILGCLVAALGFGLAMDTALTPQNAVAKPPPTATRRILPQQQSEAVKTDGGCCSKKASVKSKSECTHAHEGDACSGHSTTKPAESAPGGCTRNLDAKP